MSEPSIRLTGEKEQYARSLNIVCTKHATNRVKERFNLPRSSALRLAKSAVKNGICYFIQRKDDSVYSFIYKEKIFVFSESIGINNDVSMALLTAYPEKHEVNQNDRKQIYKSGELKQLSASDRQSTKHKKANNHRKANKHRTSYHNHEEPQG